jgi:putative transposase
MFPRRTKRLEGFVYVGRIAYFLTICTHRRCRAFDDHRFTRDAVAILLRTAAKFHFAIYAYSFMPDHVHLVVVGRRDDSDLEAFMPSLNTQLGYMWRRRHLTPLWQGGYYDHILRSEIELYFAAQYVAMNPVRAGLVTEPAQFEFTGSTEGTVEDLMKW